MAQSLPNPALATRILLCLVVLALLLVACRKLRWRTIAALAGSYTMLVALISFAAGAETLPEALRHVAGILQALASPVSTSIWLGWLIAHGKEEFPKVFSLAALGNVGVLAIFLALPEGLRTLCACLMAAGSGAIMIRLPAPEDFGNHAGARRPERRRAALFAVVRILIGVLNSLMIAVVVTLHGSGAESGIAQSALALAALGASCIAFHTVRKRSSVERTALVGLFSAIPLVAALPFCAFGLGALSPLVAVFYWFTAFSFSNVHLARNRGLCGMQSVVLVGLSIVLTSVGNVIVETVPLQQFIESLSPIARIAPMVVVSYLASLASLLLLASTFQSQTTSSQRDTDDAVASLAARYGLTPRETEVFDLLARGYSRPYISEKLVVSQATVKTHINNIYLKLGVNKHDALLKMVETERER